MNTPEPIDPFAPENLRAQQPLAEISIERVTLTVPVRRPSRTEFIRVHPDADYSVDRYVLEYDDGGDLETYWVTPELLPEVRDHAKPVRLFTAINRRGTVFIWPAKLPTPDANLSARSWAESALEIAAAAMSSWVRIAGNRSLGAYEMYKARGDLGDPLWPEKSFSDLLRLAFRRDRQRIIDTLDHPVVRALAGEL